MGPMEHSYFWGGGMFLLPILLLAALVLIAYLIARQGTQGQPRSTSPVVGLQTGESALEIVEKRYARGEIDKEEFLEIKKNLTD